MSISREQEKDFLEFWDYCREIMDVARCKIGVVLPVYNQIMIIAYAAITWNARRKVKEAKTKKEGGAK